MNIIQNKLNEIFETKITFYKFDLLNNKITMDLEKIENGIITNHKLELEKISTAYFINNTSNKRKNIFEPEEDDYLELTSLNILEKSVLFRIESDIEQWLNNYCGMGNLILEIWSNIIILEVQIIRLDEKEFVL
jgi:hypothetical protein